MSEPGDMVLRLLREIRTSIDRNAEISTERFDRLEKKLENVKQLAIGESVLGRYAAAEVEERLEQIEKRLAALEGRR